MKDLDMTLEELVEYMNDCDIVGVGVNWGGAMAGYGSSYQTIADDNIKMLDINELYKTGENQEEGYKKNLLFIELKSLLISVMLHNEGGRFEKFKELITDKHIYKEEE